MATLTLIKLADEKKVGHLGKKCVQAISKPTAKSQNALK